MPPIHEYTGILINYMNATPNGHWQIVHAISYRTDLYMSFLQCYKTLMP